uniref:Uncharacterized protein n=1 Tax=mine drainage metagenome TaxID=410659 RepID=E6Q5V5_9ZZZZ
MKFGADLEIIPARYARGSERQTIVRRANARAYTVSELAERAGIRYRVTGGPKSRVVLWNGPGNARTIDDAGQTIFAIDHTTLPQRGAERFFRILEILAYGCFDYGARESLCGRGFFVYPVTPEHGRAWLAEIGRRGGRARSDAKVAASRANGTRRRAE